MDMGYLYYSVVLLVLYFSWKLIKLFHFYFREYYVLWNIATGGMWGRRDMKANIRLHVYVCKTELLDIVSVNEMYNFLSKMMDSDVTVKGFHFLLLSYKYVVVCRERKDGSLRGVMVLGVDHKELNGVKFTLLRVGLTFFQNYYQGGPLMYYVVAYHLMKELILHPFTPLYIIGKVFSYKSYMIMCNNVSRSYPRYDLETTEFARTLISEFAQNETSPSETYNPDTFVLERERTAMKGGMAVLSEDDLKDPHIKFFVEKNPGWVNGHLLITVGECNWYDTLRMVWKRLIKTKKIRRGFKRDTLKRGRSFQNEMANRYATRYATVFSEVDVWGSRADYASEGEMVDASMDTAEPPPPRDKRLHSYNIYEDETT